MKILILGSLGNLGTQLVKIFKTDSNFEVLALNKEDLDITNNNLLLGKIEQYQPGIIINATGYNSVDGCETNPAEYAVAQKINGEALSYLAEAALKFGATLVHFSTDYVFAGTKAEGYLETDTPDPINNYGRSKLLGEQAILEAANRGLNYYLIRTSKMFGPKGLDDTAKPGFFDLMLELAAKGRPIQIVNDEKSCFTYTEDLAKETLKLVSDDHSYGIYHITNSGPATWYEAALELFTLKGVKAELLPISRLDYARPAARPANSVLLNTKLPPLRSYQEALKEFLQLI
jgi:dTDP-4-dehydrorhamnose reductase